jgi:hypothetical protein
MHAPSHRPGKATPLNPETREPRDLEVKTGAHLHTVRHSPTSDAPRMPPVSKAQVEEAPGEMTVEDHQFIEYVMADPALRKNVGRRLGIPESTLDAMFTPKGKFVPTSAFGDKFCSARTSLCLLHRWVVALNQASHEIPHDPKAEKNLRFRAVVDRVARARVIFRPSIEAFYPPGTRASVTLADED